MFERTGTCDPPYSSSPLLKPPNRICMHIEVALPWLSPFPPLHISLLAFVRSRSPPHLHLLSRYTYDTSCMLYPPPLSALIPMSLSRLSPLQSRYVVPTSDLSDISHQKMRTAHLCCRHTVSEGGSAVWCVAFNFVSPQHHDTFAAVSGNKVRARRGSK